MRAVKAEVNILLVNATLGVLRKRFVATDP